MQLPVSLCYGMPLLYDLPSIQKQGAALSVAEPLVHLRSSVACVCMLFVS